MTINVTLGTGNPLPDPDRAGQSTELGALLCRLQGTLQAGGEPFAVWFYVVPVSQQTGG